MNNNDEKTLKKQLEGFSWYDLMTSQPIIDMYVEHIRKEPVPYECKDEEKEIERHIKDFYKMLNKHGRAILKELFSDVHINEPIGDRMSKFATSFAQSYKRIEWLYWLQEIVAYTSTLIMWYAFLDKDVSNEKKDSSTQGDSVSLSATLRQLKSKENWSPSLAKAFAEVGVNSPQELTPTKLMSLAAKSRYKDEETGRDMIGIWSDDQSLHKVESWSIQKLLKVLEQNDIYPMTKTKALVVNMRPEPQKLRDERTYTEVQVKDILYGFARDLGCKWSEKELKAFIETAFDFD